MKLAIFVANQGATRQDEDPTEGRRIWNIKAIDRDKQRQ